jgi:ribosome hibernation promoting factor
MQLNLTGHHIDITGPIRDYVDSKLGRLERHFEHVTNVHVILTVDKLIHKAEATMHVSGADLFADSDAADMYAAIDGLAAKLDRQLKRHKEKLKDHHAREALKQRSA